MDMVIEMIRDIICVVRHKNNGLPTWYVIACCYVITSGLIALLTTCVFFAE